VGELSFIVKPVDKGTVIDLCSSGAFSIKIDPKVIVELHSFTTLVGVS
jgi:hypothetical protein